MFKTLWNNLVDGWNSYDREAVKAKLAQGTVLDPDNHPSYSVERVEKITKARKSYKRSLKSAKTRYENSVAD